MTTNTIDSDTLLKAFAIMEKGKADEDGWETNPQLTTFALDDTLRITEVSPWAWTCLIRGVLGPADATGDPTTDLARYADRVEPLKDFLAVALLYQTDYDYSADRSGSRVVIAVDVRGTCYRIERREGDDEPSMAELVNLDADELLPIVNRIADALRGGPAQTEN
ncbi:hypothetical protein ACIHFD_49790 [Nonomuraea sp. NPDC051941]|uniref:hypothetical protein n=1 Tax=Nonomuraea sp. NPDC051941 TaxID=3364373 RepID=UPI0037C53E89